MHLSTHPIIFHDIKISLKKEKKAKITLIHALCQEWQCCQLFEYFTQNKDLLRKLTKGKKSRQKMAIFLPFLKAFLKKLVTLNIRSLCFINDELPWHWIWNWWGRGYKSHHDLTNYRQNVNKLSSKRTLFTKHFQ